MSQAAKRTQEFLQLLRAELEESRQLGLDTSMQEKHLLELQEELAAGQEMMLAPHLTCTEASQSPSPSQQPEQDEQTSASSKPDQTR
jgi:hypothetical protein